MYCKEQQSSASHHPLRSHFFLFTSLSSLPCRVDIQNYRLRNWNAAVQRQLLERPTEYLPGLQDAIGEYVKSSEDFAGEFAREDNEILVGLKGEFGELEVSPRNLNSSQLGKLVKVGAMCVCAS
jgi:DNA replicative helicase MCM subunit Mcm2 (Cdc46/Mcm family)